MPEKLLGQRLLSDKIEKFMSWLEDNTDYSDWSPEIKKEVWMKLIECMTEQ
jgi:hypothetical protein